MEKDIELYNTWKRTQSPLDLEKLLKQLDPLIQSEVNKQVGSLSRSILETQAKVLAVKAIQAYNPNLGVKLSTHLVNQLQKLSRLNYAHKKAARVPEHTELKYHTFTLANEEFKNEYGRDPTADELADTLKWSPKKVEQFQSQMVRPELLESLESPADMFAPNMSNLGLDYAYYSMSPRQQKIFEHSTGYSGAKKLSNDQIMKKLNLTQGVLSYEKNKIKALLSKV
jgi:DNA-directed RNA polymerase specialized sigma subunit